MSNRSRRCGWVALLFASLAAHIGNTAIPARLGSQSDLVLPRLHIHVEQAMLENGLHLLTVEDHSTPVVSLVLVYNVGAANEHPGRTGFAHLFEHLMFQGSQNVTPGQHLRLIETYGGMSNATTGDDWTAFFDSVPANQLDLALFLNSDRLRSLQVTQENLTKEKEVVKEERRMRIDNQAYRKSGILLTGLLYDSFAYSHDGVGSMEDISAASLGDIKAFFNTYYTASNLTMVLVGDFQTAEVRGKVAKYFGDLPTRPQPPPADRTEPPQKAQRRKVVEDPLAPLPQLSLAFKAVPGIDPDFFALRVLCAVLQDGHSSRLYEALVKQGQLTSDVSGVVNERRGAGAMLLEMTLRPASHVEEVERIIYQQIARLQKEPIAAWELEKAKSALATAYINSLDRSVLRALTIARDAVDFNDPNRINSYLDSLASVTAKDVQRVANTYLRTTNRTVIVTLPKGTGSSK